MSAYFVLNQQVVNNEEYQKYVVRAGKVLQDHNVEVLVADFASESIEGEPRPVTVVLRFPSKTAARAWYESPEYQEIVRDRLNGTEGIGVFCDGYDPAGTPDAD